MDFHGERRQNATHQSTTDPEARLAKKGAGKEAKLCYTDSVLMENRNGIMIDLRVGQASGRAESEQGLEMLKGFAGRPDHGCRRQGLRYGGVRGELPRAQGHSPRGAEWRGRAARRSTCAPPIGRVRGQPTMRKRVEEMFGWIKTVGKFRRTRYRGVERTSFAAYLVAAAYNLLRIAKLCPSG